MNCKKGDLAVITRAGEGANARDRRLIAQLLGRVIACEVPHTMPNGKPGWATNLPIVDTCSNTVLAVADCCLTPLRAPGLEEEITTHKEIPHDSQPQSA